MSASVLINSLCDGQIKNLPRGATVIDYAYMIHTDIGNKMVAAKVFCILMALFSDYVSAYNKRHKFNAWSSHCRSMEILFLLCMYLPMQKLWRLSPIMSVYIGYCPIPFHFAELIIIHVSFIIFKSWDNLYLLCMKKIYVIFAFLFLWKIWN